MGQAGANRNEEPPGPEPLPRAEGFWEKAGCTGTGCCDHALDADGSVMIHANAPTYAIDEGLAGASVSSAEAVYENFQEVTIASGVKYKGEWKGSFPHGQGVLTRADGSRYVGGFNEGKAQGWGNSYHPDGSAYEGEWVQNDKSGNGVETYSDGTQYRGQFWLGYREGRGSYQSTAGGRIFEGEMQGDRFHGKGAYHFPDGRVFSGQWLCGQMNGAGIMDFPKDSRYAGSFMKISGHWSDGRPDGTCVVKDAEGKSVVSVWKNGKPVTVASQENENQAEIIDSLWKRDSIKDAFFADVDAV